MRLGGKRVHVAQRARVLPRRLPVRAGGRGLSCGDGSVEEHRGDVAGLLGVMREAGHVGRPDGRGGESGEDERVCGPTSTDRDGAFDREPRELVPERDRVALVAEHARCETGVELVELV